MNREKPDQREIKDGRTASKGGKQNEIRSCRSV